MAGGAYHRALVARLLCASESNVILFFQMFATAQKTQELWMWKMEYLHHEQRPLYFGEWF